MNSAAALVQNATFLLLLVTVALTGLSALRHRNRHEADLFFAVASLFLILLGVKIPIGSETPHPLQTLVILAQPYFLLRLVHYFRRVPGLLRWASALIMTLGTVVLVLLPRPRPEELPLFAIAYFMSFQMYATWAFGAESLNKSGVTAWRLRFAALGTGSFAVALLILLGGLLAGRTEALEGPVARLLSVGAILGYVFGLATPRPVRRLWQRGEVYRFLRETAERDPQDRGEHAAEDLNRAASRGAAGTASAVLLGDSHLVVRAASDVSWNGLTFEADGGLLSRARLAPAVGRPQECEGDLAPLTAAKGDHVIAVPIASHGNSGGVLLVVQRRGSLFPDDDVDLMLQLSRYTADAMDHSRLLAEERERHTQEADARVRQSESRLRVMIESITDYAMITVDAVGQVTSWNVGAAAVFGYAAGAVLDRSAAVLFGEGSVSLPDVLTEARRLGHVVREGMCRRADGTTFVGNTVIRPLGADITSADGFVVVTRDVTEQRQFAQRLQQAQKMEAIGRLAGGVAHDFNNLLTVILGYGALLESEPGINEKLRENVVEIRKAADRAAVLTRQLLTFSRQQVTEPHVVSLKAVVRELLPMLTRLLGEHIEFITDIGETRAVLADPGQLEQIVVNLAVNARDAVTDGGRITIRTFATMLDAPSTGTHLEAEAGAYAVIEVEDTGSGMSDEVKARIFEPFFTTKEVGRGTGLGLATVYGIVKQLEGGINVSSRPGGGTTFTIYLPLIDADAALAALAPAQASRGEGSGTVLLVEDEPAVRMLVATVLEQDGFRVIAAENRAEALVKIEENTQPLRLVITDVVMPGGSGPELIRLLSLTHPHLKTLFMSGYAPTVFGQNGLDPDQHFLQKPFTGRDLLNRVRQLLGE